MWSRLRFEILLRVVVRRVLTGKEPHPWWMPRRVLTVVSADVDAAAGIGAIWIVWRPESSRMREHLALMEWYGEQWRYVGGGSGSGDVPVDVEVLDVRIGAGALSLTRGLDPPRSIAAAPWIGCVKVRLGRDVDHVLFGARRIENSEQCKLIAVWTSPRNSRGDRPVVVALSRDGAELSRAGPHDGLDTHAWARLRGALESQAVSAAPPPLSIPRQ
ncbi:hypothetical protein [Streptomyces europaeiscabiei]|uniref:hypothetical protein n=1 Tax=Streptomyces europaeiscabiei TaxID=146819 RepID=UPI002E0E81A1|nr:hypothetical protein OHB30_47105 [Streptomyces europaeiscabiei]